MSQPDPSRDRIEPDAPETLPDSMGIMSPAFRATTIALVALISLYAFEALALATAMPTIAAELHGESLYAMAFSSTIAAAIVSIPLAGNLSDRVGPARPLVIGLVLFGAGLALAAAAPTMVVLVVSRIVQGLGAGMVSTAIYVLMARVYPLRLHPKILAAFSAAWVMPLIIGPFLAGLVTQVLGWRWVFGLSVLILVAAAMLLAPALREQPPVRSEVPWRWRALACSIIVSAAILALNLIAENWNRNSAIWLAVAIAVLVVAILPLLPRGTLLAARGLPTAVLLRMLLFASLSGAEIYLPRLLAERDGFEPVLAGLPLTLTGLAWSTASAVQGRWSERFELRATARVSGLLITITLCAFALAIASGAHPVVLMVVFAFMGLGIGTVYPRVTAEALGTAPAQEQGFVSAALQVADSAGAATALAITAVVFAIAGSGIPTAFVAVALAMAVPAAIGTLVAGRVRA